MIRLAALAVRRGRRKRIVGGVGAPRSLSSSSVSLAAGRVEVESPYDGEIVHSFDFVHEDGAIQAVKRAADCQREWRQQGLERRMEVCSSFATALERNKERVAADISNMMGKPLSQAIGEVNTTVDRTKQMIALAQEALADHSLPEREGFLRKITKEPVGVVLVIAPWNYPLLTAVNAIVPAVLAGNSVLVKHSPRSPLCGEHFEELFVSAGAPETLVQSLLCSHGTAAKVIAQPEVGFVSFTGSVQGGRQVYSAIADSRFIDCTLELGGKDSAYVAEDADVSASAASLVDGALYNAGQSCCSVERIYVQRESYEEFLQSAKEIVEQYVLGDPMESKTTMGPMALPQQPEFLHNQVKEAVSKGARLLCGGSPTTDKNGKGRFFAPTLIADCNHKMSIMREESFGPIAAVMPVTGEEEALKLMNDSPYGLTAAVYTADKDRALRMGEKLECGTIFQNRCDYLDPHLAWGGMKDSGKGNSLSAFGFRSFYRVKSYNLKLQQ